MSAMEIQREVRAAVMMEWPQFESHHPTLVGLLNQEAVVERAAAQLADNPEYRRAVDEARRAGMSDEAAAAGLVRGFIQDWMWRLGC